MRERSVALRLERLAGRRRPLELDLAVRDPAAEYGLAEAEVRAELDAAAAYVRRFGPCGGDASVARCAADFGLPEAEVRAELDRVRGAVVGPAAATAGAGR